MTSAALNEQRGYAYINVPKAACTSIKEAIGRQLGHNQKWLKDQPHIFVPAKQIAHRTDLFRFTFVRHPADRLVSCWIETQNPRDRILQLNRGLRKKVGLSFADFVRAVASEPDYRSNWHYAQQAYLCGRLNPGGQQLVDYVFRFERLSADWKIVQQHTGLGDLPHYRKSEHAPWQSYYNDELKQVVVKRYADDFREFGYEWNWCAKQ